MRYAIVSIAIGENFVNLAKLTWPRFEAYAKRIGADFIPITELKVSVTSPHWEKFQLYDLLLKYDRILYLDCDVLIRNDADNLFDIVPQEKLGMFNESPFTPNRGYSIEKGAEDYGIKGFQWDGKYYNTGVMVISKEHRYLFKKPEREIFNFFEQTYINLMVQKHGTLVHDIHYKFNRMSCMDQISGEPRHASQFIHFAGINPDIAYNIAKRDIDILDTTSKDKVWAKHIWISVEGGLGDQVQAEPTIRYLVNMLHPHDDIRVTTHFPELFQHLDVLVAKHGEPVWRDVDTYPFKRITLPSPDTPLWTFLSNMLCHTVDFAAISVLRRTLPDDWKRYRLEYPPHAKASVLKHLAGTDVKTLVLIHPGQHWQNKCQPMYSKIKIPGGWTTMSNIKIGDDVCTPDGKVSKVDGIYKQGIKKVFKITFYDGRQAECTEDHIWRVYNESFGWSNSKGRIYSQWRLMTIKDIFEKKYSRPLYIQLPEKIYAPEVDLPIPPYLLGCLLGDGCFSQNQSLQYASEDDEVIENMKKHLKEGYHFHKYKDYYYTITAWNGNKDNKYKKELQSLNLWGKLSGDKFIPEIYKEASHEQRLELLQGLMDTDGFASESKNIAFYTVSEKLAKDVQYLVRSLGGLCLISKRERPNSKSKLGKTAEITCNIRHDNPEFFFKLSRKKNRAFRINTHIKRKCKIEKIEYIGEMETQCISIDHPDHLYITDDFIVTHNTFPKWFWSNLVDSLIGHGLTPVIIGKDDETRGVVALEHREGMISLVNMLNLHELMAVIDLCPMLISNDSAPIHIAGAFDNNIILIPTCKHPDHLLPWRNGSKYYKAKAMYKTLLCDEISSSPTEVYTVLGDGMKGQWEQYLPDVQDIIEQTLTMLGDHEQQPDK